MKPSDLVYMIVGSTLLEFSPNGREYGDPTKVDGPKVEEWCKENKVRVLYNRPGLFCFMPRTIKQHTLFKLTFL